MLRTIKWNFFFSTPKKSRDALGGDPLAGNGTLLRSVSPPPLIQPGINKRRSKQEADPPAAKRGLTK